MDVLFVPLASLIGASVDQVKLITCLLVSYPLGSVFIRIPASQPRLKHLFNLTIAVIYFLPVLKLHGGFAQLVASVLGTFLLAKYVRGPWMPWIVFAFVMGHLTINHVIRVMYDFGYETVEITGAQMVLTMKLTTFAWNVWDGRRPVEDLDKWQMAKRVIRFPSLLEFLGFSFFFPGALVGPYLDYAEYTALVDESLFNGAAGRTKPGRAIPVGRKRVAYRKMVTGLVFLGMFVVLGGKCNFAVSLTPWFASKGLVYRIAYHQLCGFIERCKYYAVWTLTEGASILTGLGFTGFSPSGESLWEGAANVRVLSIEFAPNFKVLLDSWNMKANVWLRECVYKRVTRRGKKPGFSSSMITFATSAFWHGIAGGYYLTFIFGGFVTTAGRLCRAHLRPLVLPAPGTPDTAVKRVYDVLGTVVTVLVLNFTATPFMLLTVADSLEAWRRLGWYGLWMVGGALVFFYGGGGMVLKKAQGMRPPVVTIEKVGGRKEEVKVSSVREGTLTPSESFQLPPSLDQVVLPTQ